MEIALLVRPLLSRYSRTVRLVEHVANHDLVRSVSYSLPGLAIALSIIALWCITLVYFVSLDIRQAPVLVIVLGVAIRAFLHTGIFITTHEAIHGVITKNHKIDDLIGSATAFLYALLPYDQLAVNHRLHHQFPATNRDPDYCADSVRNPLAWYLSFMKRYQAGAQAWILFWGMTVIFWTCVSLQIPVINLLLFWVLPILLSSWQLFIFGIYLPHRPIKTGYRDRHRASSIHLSPLWSFAACYHFGYHYEHHRYPHLAWYELPAAYRRDQALSASRL